MDNKLCRKCQGLGRAGYSNTSTYMHGCGGDMITNDICDQCWGSGDENKPFTNIRELIEKRTGPGTIDARFESVIQFARDAGLCTGFEAKPGELFLMEEYKRLENKVKALLEELDETIAYSTTAQEEKCGLCPNDIPITAYLVLKETLEQIAEKIPGESRSCMNSGNCITCDNMIALAKKTLERNE